jgi:hypothetical protein
MGGDDSQPIAVPPRLARKRLIKMDDYTALLERMKVAQVELIAAAAKAKTLPSDGALRKIADLEVAIGALEHLIEDGALPQR